MRELLGYDPEGRLTLGVRAGAGGGGSAAGVGGAGDEDFVVPKAAADEPGWWSSIRGGMGGMGLMRSIWWRIGIISEQHQSQNIWDQRHAMFMHISIPPLPPKN
jgi:hypothetical protein